MAMPPLSSRRPASGNRSDHSQEARPPGAQLCPGTLLPGAVVRRIIGYLPVSMHGQCALVCRSWYAHIPDTRKTLEHWWQDLSLWQQHRCRHLASAYSSRIRPFLEAGRCHWLPVLDAQYQELQRLQGGPEPQRRSAYALLSGLIGLSLFRQRLDPDPLALPEAPVADDSGLMAAVDFSACSRWMAAARRRSDTTDGPAFLRLYGWNGGGWEPETLQRSLSVEAVHAWPVERLLFSASQPDRLCTSHSGGGLISWQRQRGTGSWCPVILLPSCAHRICEPVAYAGHHLFVLYKETAVSGRGLLLLHDQAACQDGSLTPAAWYSQLAAITPAPGASQVAMAVSDADSDLMTIHIWERSSRSTPGAWYCTPTPLESDKQVLQLHYSPDGRHLLGLLTGQQACLWQVDDERCLQLRLHVACAFSAASRDLAAWRPFDHKGRRLALAVSGSEIRFYDGHDTDRWQQGELLVNAPRDGDPPENSRYILLSGDGRLLVQVNYHKIHLWSCDEGARRFWHQTAMGVRWSAPVLPQAWLLPPFNSFCATTALWEKGNLWIHGAESCDLITKKASTPQGPAPLTELVCSPDGLSQVVIGGSPRRARVRQLTTLEQVCSAASRTRRLPGPSGAALQAKDKAAGIRAPGPAQTLPGDVLYLIFDFLSLQDQGQCALVCRHWYHHLPGSRDLLARWRQERAPRLRPELYQLADSYDCISRPRLRADRSPLLPVLEGLHRRCQEQAAMGPGGIQQALRHSLSGLIHQSLHQRLLLADRLVLQRPVIHGSIRASVRTRLSDCGRWLATAQRPDPAVRQTLLHIHRRTSDGWQPESLDATADTPVTGFVFCRKRPATLIACHPGSHLFCWTRQPDTGLWRSEHMVSLRLELQTQELFSMSCGGVAILYRTGNMMEKLVLVPWQEQKGAWGRAVSHLYPRTLGPLAVASSSSQLANVFPAHTPGGSHTIDIWSRDPVVPGEWIHKEEVVHCQQAIVQLIYSPDGEHLLGLLADNSARLWQVEARLRLRQRLNLACCPFSEADLKVWQPFREDGRQLVLAPSLAQIQLWDRQPCGRWQAGDSINSPPPAAVTAYPKRVRYLRVSADGRTLMRAATWELGIWRRAQAGDWHKVLSRCGPCAADEPYINGWLVPAGGPLCVTTAGRESLLWIHAPDSQGRLIRKAECAVGQFVLWLYASPDGHSLRLVLEGSEPLVLQLATVAEDAAKRADASASPVQGAPRPAVPPEI